LLVARCWFKTAQKSDNRKKLKMLASRLNSAAAASYKTQKMKGKLTCQE
jgi:hypothetical protein